MTNIIFHLNISLHRWKRVKVPLQPRPPRPYITLIFHSARVLSRNRNLHPGFDPPTITMRRKLESHHHQTLLKNGVVAKTHRCKKKHLQKTHLCKNAPAKNAPLKKRTCKKRTYKKRTCAKTHLQKLSIEGLRIVQFISVIHQIDPQ